MPDSRIKKLEYFIKKKLEHIFDKKTPPILIDKAQNLFNFNDPQRILLLRHDRIGDVLISTPLIKLLRQRFPNSEIDILLSEKNISAKNAIIDSINTIYIYKKNFFKLLFQLRKLHKRKYDLVIDLFDNQSATSGLLIKFIDPLYSLGLDKENRNIYSHVVPLEDKSKVHIVERILKLLLPFGINPNPKSCFLNYELCENDKIVATEMLGIKQKSLRLGINLSGSSPAKYWGTENYISFIQKIQQLHHEFEVILFAIPELQDINIIIEKTNAKLAPLSTDFHQYAAMLSTCDAIISVDTSAVHLAASFRIPCVALYSIGNSDLLPWYPYNSPHHILTTNEPLDQIKVDDVLNVLEDLL